MKIEEFSRTKTDVKKRLCHKKLRKRTNFAAIFYKKGKVLGEFKQCFSYVFFAKRGFWDSTSMVVIYKVGHFFCLTLPISLSSV